MDSAAGDIFINLKDEKGEVCKLQLRPSIGFIRKLDQRGVKLIALLKRFRENEYGLNELALVVWASAVESITLEAAESLIFNTGVASEDTVLPVIQVIANALNGGRPAKPKTGEEAENPQI